MLGGRVVAGEKVTVGRVDHDLVPRRVVAAPPRLTVLGVEPVARQAATTGGVGKRIVHKLEIDLIADLDLALPRRDADRHHAHRRRGHATRRTVGRDCGRARQDLPGEEHTTGERHIGGVAGRGGEQAGIAGLPPGRPRGNPHGSQRPGIGREERPRSRVTGLFGAAFTLRRQLARHAGPSLEGWGRLRDVEEQILLRRQVGKRRGEGLVNLLEELPAGPLGLGLLPRGHRLADVLLDGRRRLDEGVERRIWHDA